jgi:hypothetical protein
MDDMMKSRDIWSTRPWRRTTKRSKQGGNYTKKMRRSRTSGTRREKAKEKHVMEELNTEENNTKMMDPSLMDEFTKTVEFG